MNGQVEMVAGKRELANIFVHKLTYFGRPLHSGLVAGLCHVSKRAQGRAEMIDLIEVHHAKPAGNGKEPSNAPKKHSDSLRHLAVGTGEPFTLVKVRAFARRESPAEANASLMTARLSKVLPPQAIHPSLSIRQKRRFLMSGPRQPS